MKIKHQLVFTLTQDESGEWEAVIASTKSVGEVIQGKEDIKAALAALIGKIDTA